MLTTDPLPTAIALLVIGQAPATISTGLTALFYVYEKAEYPAAIRIVTVLIKIAIGVPVPLSSPGSNPSIFSGPRGSTPALIRS